MNFRARTIAIVAVLLALVVSDSAGAANFKSVYNFCSDKFCRDGSENLSNSPLTEDGAGNFYGVTSRGGPRNGGVIFELSFNSTSNHWDYRKLFAFGNKPKFGYEVSGPLIIDTHGNLYGAARLGGTVGVGNGTVFRLSPNADRTDWKIKLLYEFCPHMDTCPDGQGPQRAGLTYAAAASGAPYDGQSPLFGTTGFGGAHGQGVLFKLVPQGGNKKWVETVLHDFCAQLSGVKCLDGGEPQYPLAIDAAGKVFGVAQFGNNDDGIAYEFDTLGAGDSFTVLHQFCSSENCADGAFPLGGLTLNPASDLLGTTSDGGAHFAGTLFKLVPNGASSELNILHSFCVFDCTGGICPDSCRDGSAPSGVLALDAEGRIYGATAKGGLHHSDPDDVGGGTIFSFDNGSFQTLYNFCARPNCADGAYPQTGVVIDQNGHLLGVTPTGGTHNGGNIFEVTP